MSGGAHDIEFFRSALADESVDGDTAAVLDWLREKNSSVRTAITQVPLSTLRQWSLNESTGSIVHVSGKFFSIEGIRVETNWGSVSTWDQPIINQPEVGFLGIIAARRKGVLHLLMQAKIEPGNLNKVQLSPTLQATKSNYRQIHKGARPRLLEYFNGERSVHVMFDQLQSEQGARFLRKRNRNLIVEVAENDLGAIPDDFVWVTLGQLKRLMRHDNVVNMDTRSVLAGISFGTLSAEVLAYLGALNGRGDEAIMASLLNSDVYLHDIKKILSWLSDLKSRYDLSIRNVRLTDLDAWHYDGATITHEASKYFSVIGISVSIGNREVVNWDQPMIKPAQEGILAFIVKRIKGVHHFLVQAKLEAGNFDVIEFAPTVQCLTGNYRTGKNEYAVPFLEHVLGAEPEKVWYSAMQSEEGGRFFEEQNRNMIVEVGDEFSLEVPENYCWMTLHQIHTFMMFNNFLNIAARSLIAAIPLR